MTKRRKTIIWVAVIAGLVGLIVVRAVLNAKNASLANIQTGKVTRQNLNQTVLATGQVVSGTDLDLSFQISGVVKSISAVEGVTAKAGQVLAVLDQSAALAALTTARGNLAAAQANYDKVLAGASSEQITVSEKAVASAQTALVNSESNLNSVRQQEATLVANAHSILLNSTLALVPGPGNSGTSPTISGTYTASTEGQYRITIYLGGGYSYTVSGLGNNNSVIPSNALALSPLGSDGLYLQFPAGAYHPEDFWTVDIPNKNAGNYLTNLNAYQAALQAQQVAVTAAQASVDSAQTALAEAQANRAQEQAAARPADIDAARAQIISAQGQALSAQANYDNTVIKAPSDGTVTSVDIKVGEQATAQKEAIILQNVADLHTEADISEANVAALQPGQTVDYTFDALGPDKHYPGTILIVNPASVVISGVVNYKVKASLAKVPVIKPGMTANLTVLVAQHANALAVPAGAVINLNGKQYVRVIDEPKNKAYHTVEVTIGLQADGGLTEITSGLSEGQMIVTYIKT